MATNNSTNNTTNDSKNNTTNDFRYDPRFGSRSYRGPGWVSGEGAPDLSSGDDQSDDGTLDAQTYQPYQPYQPYQDPTLDQVAELRTGESPLASVLGEAVRGLYEKGSSTAKAKALWAEVVGPVGVRHTRGLYVKEPENPQDPDELPTLYVYLDSNTFVYEYLTDRMLYEQRLAYLGFPVKELVPRLSRSAGMPAPSTPMEPGSLLDNSKPKARPLDELEPLDADFEQWARQSVQTLPDGLADALYGAMTSTQRRNQAEGR